MCILFALSFTLFGAETLIRREEAAFNLLSEAEKAGASFFWDPLSESGIIEKNGRTITFREGSAAAVLDNNLLLSIDPPESKNGSLYVSRNFLSLANLVFADPPGTASPRQEGIYKIGAILIDPGHGGKDPGTNRELVVNGGKVAMREKDITLDVSKMLYEKLRRVYPDKKILLTRDDDRTLSLDERVDMAHAVPLQPHEAVLYISVHVNASPNKKASGFEVWYLNPDFRRVVIDKDGSPDVNTELFPILNNMMEEEYTTESILIANFILEGLTSSIGAQSPSRGVKAEEWFVVRKANMPSVLVELGFLTNDQEAKLLASPSYLNKAAEGIYNGLVSFVTHFEQSRGFTGAQ
jgi:N-acetylmuramoyl-L-alanine amidase